MYLLQWYGGYDPIAHDVILGELSGYGFKDVLYSNGQSGRVYVSDYMLGKIRAIEKFNDKCGWRQNRAPLVTLSRPRAW